MVLADLAWVAALAVAQESAPPSEGGAYLELYDLRDLALPARMRGLLQRAPDADPQALAVEKRWVEKLSSEAGSDDELHSDRKAWELVSLLARSASGGSAKDATFEAQPGGALVVRAPASVHQRIDRMLKGLREPDHAVVAVEVRLFELDAKQRARFAAGDESETAILTLPTEEAESLARSVPALMAPRLTTFQLDPFETFVGSQVAYVAGLEQVSIEGMGTIADPVVKLIREGVTVRGRAVAAPGVGDEKAPYALRLEIEVTALKRPIEQKTCDLGVLQLPELKHATIATTVSGRVKVPILLGGVPKPSFDEKDPGRRLYALVTVDLVASPAPPEPARAR